MQQMIYFVLPESQEENLEERKMQPPGRQTAFWMQTSLWLMRKKWFIKNNSKTLKKKSKHSAEYIFC